MKNYLLLIFTVLGISIFCQGQLVDSIYYAKAINLYSLNYSRPDSLAIRPGQVFILQGYNKDGDSVRLKSKEGWIVIIKFKTDYPIEVSNLNYHFWPGKLVTSIKKKYGIGTWNSILKKELRIGWNKELCKLSWGEPEDINTTTSGYGSIEQWVYGSSYLYFENGKLTIVQH